MIHLDLSPPLLAIYVPLIGALLISLAGRWPNLRETVTLLTAGTLLWVVAGMVPHILAPGFWAAYAKAPPLRIVEVLPLDTRRKAVLLARDNVQHLVILGANGEIVVETGIPFPASGSGESVHNGST